MFFYKQKPFPKDCQDNTDKIMFVCCISVPETKVKMIKQSGKPYQRRASPEKCMLSPAPSCQNERKTKLCVRKTP